MKTRPIIFSGEMVRAILEGRQTQTRRVITNLNLTLAESNPQPEHIANAVKCVYGKVGDRLYVKETWNAICDGLWWHETRLPLAEKSVLNWAITNPILPAFEKVPPRWISSMFMPRWATRVWLEMTDIHVERLQDVSQVDAIAEGAQGKHSFATSWDSINAKRGFPWSANPHCWVLEFKRVFP